MSNLATVGSARQGKSEEGKTIGNRKEKKREDKSDALIGDEEQPRKRKKQGAVPQPNYP